VYVDNYMVISQEETTHRFKEMKALKNFEGADTSVESSKLVVELDDAKASPFHPRERRLGNPL